MRNLKLFLAILVSALVCYGLHKLILAQVASGELINRFYYSLESIYLFFTAFSFVVLTVVLLVRRKNLHATGQAFIAATFVKMVAAYAFLYPALATDSESTAPGKLNFFAVFMVFLLVETAVCTRLLNRS